MFRRARAPRVLWTLALIAPIAVSGVTTPAQQEAPREGRATSASEQALVLCRDWLGVSVPPADHDLLPFDTASTMTREASTAHDVLRRCVDIALPAGEQALRPGLARYLHALVVERLFDQRYQRLAYSLHAEPLFGGFVQVPTRGIHRTRLTALREDDDTAARVSRGFLALEQMVGLPRLQHAVQAVAARKDVPMVATMEAALGQELQWLFDDLVAGREFDLTLVSLSSDASTCEGAQPCYRTRVILERRGQATFERALGLAMTFADGSTVEESVSGGAALDALWFESPAPAVNAALDPRRIAVVDRSLLDNFQTLSPATNVNVARWVSQWTVWLQQALLTHAYFF
jgi:hypothetical protein